MDLLFTAFGLSHRPIESKKSDIFYRMPPVGISAACDYRFSADAAVLLLCDKIILDQLGFEQLMSDPHPLYQDVSQTLKAFYDEGFIRLEDFDSIIHNNNDLLEEMLKRDLKRLDEWVKPFTESLRIWKEFTKGLSLLDMHYIDPVFDFHTTIGQSGLGKARLGELIENLASSTKRRQSDIRQHYKQILSFYLSYVNVNLVLSNSLGVGFHDWMDYQPFYREKLINVGKVATVENKNILEIKKLFEVAFPEFQSWGTKDIIRALKDKRIRELRNLVQDAVEGKVTFDQEFAHRILLEVLKTEQKINGVRNIVSYLTIPLSFVPWIGTPLEKGADELIGRVVEHKMKKKYQWFYLISELSYPKT